jgi:hypothetical protein
MNSMCHGLLLWTNSMWIKLVINCMRCQMVIGWFACLFCVLILRGFAWFWFVLMRGLMGPSSHVGHNSDLSKSLITLGFVC